MIDELEVLRVVIERLEYLNIPYMISGSMALNFYAEPRMTRDIDIVIDLKIKDVRDFYESFNRDFYIDKEAVEKAVRCRGFFNIIHNKEVIKIDFIVKKDSLYRKTELDRRQIQRIEDFYLYITTPEDLILSKLVWAKDSRSELQLRDIRNLLKATREILDTNYLERWAGELNVELLLTQIMHEQDKFLDKNASNYSKIREI